MGAGSQKTGKQAGRSRPREEAFARSGEEIEEEANVRGRQKRR